MKFILLIFVSLSLSSKMIAQDSTIILIDQKKAAEAVSGAGETEAVLVINKLAHKKFKFFIVKVAGEHIVGEVYKRSLEITGETSIEVAECKNKPGYFDISGTAVKDQLAAGKTLSLHLLLNPANPLMAIPSRRIFLGNLVMK